MNFSTPITTFAILLSFKRIKDIMLHPYRKGIGHITHHIARHLPSIGQVEPGSTVEDKLNGRCHIYVIPPALVHIGFAEKLHVQVHIGLFVTFIRYGQGKVTE